jgi:hypothetical protein
MILLIKHACKPQTFRYKFSEPVSYFDHSHIFARHRDDSMVPVTLETALLEGDGTPLVAFKMSYVSPLIERDGCARLFMDPTTGVITACEGESHSYFGLTPAEMIGMNSRILNADTMYTLTELLKQNETSGDDEEDLFDDSFTWCHFMMRCKNGKMEKAAMFQPKVPTTSTICISPHLKHGGGYRQGKGSSRFI